MKTTASFSNSQQQRKAPMFRLTTLLNPLILLISISSLLSHMAFAAPPPTPHWSVLAKHVGQNEKASEVAIAKLRETKDLKETLLKALSTSQRPLALDVISALKMTEVVPTLLKEAAKDEDGHLVLSLNSLLRVDNKDKILGSYLRSLTPRRQKALSPAAIIAMMEPIGRLGTIIPEPTIEALFEHEYPEVRASLLIYARAMTLEHRNKEYVSLATKALARGPGQVRLQALYWLEELIQTPELAPAIAADKLNQLCKAENNPALKARCQDIVNKRSRIK